MTIGQLTILVLKQCIKKEWLPSSARNEGIKKANGDYICFVDSDDYVSRDFIENLLNSIKNNNTKIAIQCDIDLVSLNGDSVDKWKTNEDYYVVEGRQLVLDSMRENVQNIVVWNRMYSKDLLNNA